MNSYRISKFLVGVASIAVAALLYVSIAPIAFGGLDVKVDKDLEVDFDGANLNVDGSISISSNMPWDLSINYKIILGTEDNPIISSEGSTDVPSGTVGTLSLNLTATTEDLMLYFLSSMDSEFKSNGIDGIFFGHFMLPMTVLIYGDYIQKIVTYSINIGLDLGGNANGNLNRDVAGAKLNGGVTFDDRTAIGLPQMNATFTFSIMTTDHLRSIDGHITFSTSASGDEQSISYDMTASPTGDTIHDILEYVQNNGGFFKLNGSSEIALGPQQISVLAYSINGMLGQAGVTP